MINDKQKQRLTEIAESAAKLFRTRTYKYTQMADIAQDLEMSVGMLYIYMKSKKALFDFTLMYIFDEDVFSKEIELPFTGIEHKALFEEYVENAFQKYISVLNTKIKTDLKQNDFEESMNDIFLLLSKYWKGMLIIERNGISWPYLLEGYNKMRKNAYGLFEQYFNNLIKQNILRPLKDINLSFYLFIESFALFAMHRHDRSIKNITEEQARETVIDAMKHAFLNKELL
jgi:AcrR family transcriptional regulator